MSTSNALHVGHLFIGGGPGGLAPLLAASKAGLLRGMLEDGLAIVERGPRLGRGELGRYIITSDSTGETFLSCLVDNPEPELSAILDTPVGREIAAAAKGAIPLKLGAELLDLMGDALQTIISRAPRGHVLTNTEMSGLTQMRGGTWRAEAWNVKTDASLTIFAGSVLTATGANHARDVLEQRVVGGLPLSPRYADKLVTSADMLADGGPELLLSRLEGVASPKIAIIGGSTSALACANLFLQTLGDRLGTGGVTVLHREALRIFYHSRDAAAQDGYEAYDENDICALSGFVHRFGGFRLDSRDLAMRVLGVGAGAASRETRIATHRLPPFGDESHDPRAHEILAEANVIVACTGYRPRGIPLSDEAGAPILLHSHGTDRKMVDSACRVLDETGTPIPGLFGIGLAAGFKPPIEMGGEPSFRGQVNGLWLWQNDIGRLIANSMIRHLADVRAVETA